MPHRYFYPHPFEKHQTILLDKEELKHIKKVMRTKAGDKIEVINGKGEVATCIFDENITVERIEKHPLIKENALALALTEPKHLEFVIEKGTELGISHFYLFPSKKSKLRSLSSSKQERLFKILISALKQSKRLHLPKVHILNNKEELPKNSNYLLADFNGSNFKQKTQPQTFIIGPESGFTDEEISFFKKDLKATGTLLSDAVLRTETAALAASTLLSL